ncbi:MAG: hypothetical protein HC892_21805 [Saprospiraceae bacterium]|nr:hypothetical protein [Saprospiraceae bacterium]
MFILLICTSALLLLGTLGYLAWKLTPKGTILAEMLDLIPFWSYLLFKRVRPMKSTRYQYGGHWRQYLLVLQPQDEVVSQKM